MVKQIFTIILAMLLLVTTVFAAVPTNPLDFGEGLLFVGSDLPEHHLYLGDTFEYNFKTFQKSNGLEVDNQTCYYRMVLNKPLSMVETKNVTFSPDWTGIISINSSVLNMTGDYTFGVICQAEILIESPDVYSSEGGYMQIDFEVVETTAFGIWEEPEDWTFPVIYLILTFVIIMIGLAYTSSLLGVLGSVMLIMAYFLVGATSPILFTPLLIVGFLLAFKFATLD